MIKSNSVALDPEIEKAWTEFKHQPANPADLVKGIDTSEYLYSNMLYKRCSAEFNARYKISHETQALARQNVVALEIF